MDALKPEPQKISLGQRVGNYRLTRLLGSGAFAHIYLGKHCYLQTSAAVKIARRRLTQEQGERFLKEARIAAQLIHPLIIRVLEFGCEHGIPYLVMDYAPHGSLRQQYPIGESLDAATILSYASDIAQALDYIHESNYIHRDLKPENLLLGPAGQILVSDFGIALAVQETWGQTAQESIGTLPYMAPEQITGHPCPASDQYSLGVIVYEWICGQLPFDEEDEDIAWQQLNARPPALCTLVPNLPPAVDRVVAKALQKDPRQRFSSVTEFVAHLEAAWDDDVQGTPQNFAFYGKTTDVPEEVLKRQQRAIEASPQMPNGNVESARKWSTFTWKQVSYCFALDLFLSVVARLTVADTGWSLLWLIGVLLIAGLPIGAGLFRQDQRTVTLGVIAFVLEVMSTVVFEQPLAFIQAGIAASALCALITLAAYLRFLN